MNKYQKVINQITKDDVRSYIHANRNGFRKTRILIRAWIKDLDLDELINYKNLREAL